MEVHATRYKNYKNFINLCYHKDDPGITAERNFFAIGHGENTCDGVDGTVKWLATRATLQRTTDNYILSSKDLYKFSFENIKGIKTFHTTSRDINMYCDFFRRTVW